jgi:hypothetical protein
MVAKLKTSFTASSPALSMSACIDLICRVGQDITVIVEGDMGAGKTSMGKEIARRLGMRLVYFDAVSKSDVGELFMPNFHKAANGEIDCVSMIPHEEFGIHLKEDVVLMIDEYGKNRGIQNALNRVMYERVIGSRPMTKRSIVFATTNLGAENVGDMMQPQGRNRVMIVRMLKPSFDEWLAWASTNNIEPALIGAAHENPHFFRSFTEYEDPAENVDIYDPRVPSRVSFVTPRSLAACSPVLRERAFLGNDTVHQALAGLVGGSAAASIMTIVNIDDALPTYEEIVRHPDKAPVPESAVAKIVVAIKVMQRVEQTDYDNAHDYILRMPMEIQGVFFNQIMKHPAKKDWVASTNKFTQFIRKNFVMFTTN